ncbi:MAG TPA: carboxylesterase [Gammaproteobacteria bacterium]
MDLDTPAVVVAPAGPVRAGVVWLHGLGADGHDFAPLVPELRLPPALGVRFVLPHAAPRPVTVNGGMVMRAWYDILELDLARRVDLAQVDASAAAVHALLDAEVAAGIPPERLVLAGFSQGGVVALRAGLAYPRRLAGIIGCSCYLADPHGLAALAAPANRATPVLLAHGRHDPLVPLALGEAARDAVGALGNPVEWHAYPMEHAVCAEQVADLRRWLQRVLAAPGDALEPGDGR